MISKVPRSQLVFDASVVGFALWTLCCHVLVLLRGNANQLAVAAALLALAGATVVAVPRLRARACAFLSGDDSDLSLAPDDALDRKSRWVAAGCALSLLALWLITRDAWLCWSACVIYALVASGFLLRRPWAAQPATAVELQAPVQHERLVWILVALCACITLCLHRDNTDDSFYVNVAVAAVDFPRDVLFSLNTLHGLPSQPPAMYHVTSFELLGAMISRVSGISALLVIHLLLGTLGGMAMPLGLARLLRMLDPQRWACLLIAALTLYLFDGTTQFGFSMHGFARIYQGKAIMWSVLLPATMAYGIAFGHRPTASRFVLLLCAQIAGVGLSSTGLWLMPVASMVSVCIPLVFRLSMLRILGLALLATSYNVLVALWVRAHVGAPSAGQALSTVTSNVQGPSFELIGKALLQVFGNGTLTTFYVGVLLLAPAFARNRLARRYLIALCLVVVAIMINPFLFTFLRKNLLGGSTYDRALWLLPLPAALAFCSSALIPSIDLGARRHALGIAASVLMLFTFYVTLPDRTNMPAQHLRFPPGPKVQLDEYAIAERMTAALPAGSFVVAPRTVSVHLPLLHHYLHPVIAKENFFRGAELERRVALRDAITRRGKPIRGERARWLRAELDHYQVAGVVMSSWSSGTKGLKSTLKKAGFKPLAEVATMHLWTRKLPAGTKLPH